MNEEVPEGSKAADPGEIDVAAVVRQTLEEFTRSERSRSEPAYKAELQEERKRREQLERRLNDVIEENRRNRLLAEEAERSTTIRAELQRLGVGKIELAFRAVKDEIGRTEDGRLMAKTDSGEVGLKDYLASFVAANPELLPARISGGTGMATNQKAGGSGPGSVDLDKIRPGMSRDEMERARQEIARIALQTLRGQS
jgi:hypothetical protein